MRESDVQRPAGYYCTLRLLVVGHWFYTPLGTVTVTMMPTESAAGGWRVELCLTATECWSA